MATRPLTRHELMWHARRAAWARDTTDDSQWAKVHNADAKRFVQLAREMRNAPAPNYRKHLDKTWRHTA